MLIHRARSSVRAAAAAFSPGPLIAWFKGLGGGSAAGGAAAGGTGGLATAGSSAGAGLLATSAVKVGVIVATSAVVADRRAVRPSSRSSRTSAPRRRPCVVIARLRRPRRRTPSPIRRADRPSGRRRQRTPLPRPPGAGSGAPTQSAPAPAPAPADAPAAAPGRRAQLRSRDPARIPASSSRRADDDDLILVEEDPPDYAAGERDIPLGGLPDDSGVDVNLPDRPDGPTRRAGNAPGTGRRGTRRRARTPAAAGRRRPALSADAPATPDALRRDVSGVGRSQVAYPPGREGVHMRRDSSLVGWI